jgi:hypothetical protein
MARFKGPPIPEAPEPVEALRARYPRALEPVYDAVAIRDRGATRPGEVAANVFDFEDGMRLIINRERMPDGELVLHVSASVRNGSALGGELRDAARTKSAAVIKEMMAFRVGSHFHQLSGETGLELAGWTGGGVPHFTRKLEG